jgi:small ligand-binding sensory domain FIST
MPFASGLSTSGDTKAAVKEACDQALAQFPGAPELALVFFSPHHAGDAQDLLTACRSRLGTGQLLGCIGEAIVGNDREIEQGPGLSLWLAGWSNPMGLTSFHLEWTQTAEGGSLLGWPDELTEAGPGRSLLLLLGDAFTFPTEEFLGQINEERPGLAVAGGMASGVRAPGECLLLAGDQVHDQGAVGVLIEGPVKVRTIVSQGCRPVGRHFVITRGQQNVIAELSGKTPLQQLRELWQDLNSQDRALVQHGLHVGRVINEYQDEFRRGDFLIRNVLGIDQETGALAITDAVRVGQTVQFHVRDAGTADEDLRTLLQRESAGRSAPPRGALLFTCNGRGSRLFPQPDHDTRVIQAELGRMPLAGFFAQGELGRIGGKNFIHGFTASIALFDD